MDEGLPISYQVLDEGVPVYDAAGAQVGTVEHVVAVSSLDIFHGLVLRTENTSCFVAADQVASLHEHGVDLRITSAEVGSLPPAAADAPPEDAKPTPWAHFIASIGGKNSRSNR